MQVSLLFRFFNELEPDLDFAAGPPNASTDDAEHHVRWDDLVLAVEAEQRVWRACQRRLWQPARLNLLFDHISHDLTGPQNRISHEPRLPGILAFFALSRYQKTNFGNVPLWQLPAQNNLANPPGQLVDHPGHLLGLVQPAQLLTIDAGGRSALIRELRNNEARAGRHSY